jgi:Flp pilus assembly protein TadD
MLPLAGNMLAGAAALAGKTAEAVELEASADKSTPDDPYFHWMLGQRLQNVGMNTLAEKHFERAIRIDPKFRGLRNRQ